MMRALLLLCLVGAAIYGFLVVTEDALKDADLKRRRRYPNSAESFSGRTTEFVGFLPTQSVTKPKSAISDLSAGYFAFSREEPTKARSNTDPLPQGIVRVRLKARA